MEEAIVAFNKFTTLSNTGRAWELDPKQLTVATNFDITKYGTLRTRGGYALSLSGNYKNLWSNPWIILATSGDDLVRVYPDLSGVSIVRTQVGSGRMSYCTVNDLVVYTNEQVIGYIRGYIDYSFPTPTDANKRGVEPGQLVEYFKNHLYIASNNVLWFTDTASKRWGSIDARVGARQLASRIKLLKAVDDGLYIGDENFIYFASGVNPEKMTLDRVSFAPAIEGMVKEIEGTLLPQPMLGRCLAICSTDGLYIAGNGGQITNVTNKFYNIGSGVYGTILFRKNNNGMNQLVLSIRR